MEATKTEKLSIEIQAALLNLVTALNQVVVDQNFRNQAGLNALPPVRSHDLIATVTREFTKIFCAQQKHLAADWSQTTPERTMHAIEPVLRDIKKVYRDEQFFGNCTYRNLFAKAWELTRGRFKLLEEL